MGQDGKKATIADLGLITVALLWGGGFVAVKDAIASIPPFAMIAFRFLASSILLGAVFSPKLRSIRKDDLFKGLLLGFFLFAAFGFQTSGAKFTLASKSAFITGGNIVLVPFVVWVLRGPRPKPFQIISALVCFAGIGLITLRDANALNLGDFLTIGCAVLFAVHIALVGDLAKRNDPILLALLQMFFAGLFAALVSLAFERGPIRIGPGLIGSLAYMALFSTCAAFLLQNIAQKYSPPSHAALILGLESFFGPIFAVILLGDPVSFRLLLGGFLVLSGIFLSEARTKKSFPDGYSRR